jgi:uncharacterized protein (TIGR00297 family)
MQMRLLLGLLISSAIGIVAYRRGSLSASGALGAVITGTTIFGFGGWIAGILLVAFFVSSSALSKFKAQTRAKRDAAELFDKGGRRDIWQALANGGAAAGLAALSALAGAAGNPQLATALYAGMLGALATVTADTWATELGVLSRSAPRLITTLKPVVPGTSGGISAAGSLAALAGATFIGLLYYALTTTTVAVLPIHNPHNWLGARALATVIAGMLGAFSDSLMGATSQAQYFSVRRAKPTERAIDVDGSPNQLVHGWRWMNNDWVNFLSSLLGAALAAALQMGTLF